MKVGILIAEVNARIINKIANRLGYIISKGGITTHILLKKGLKLNAVNLKGQILPGLSVVTSFDSGKNTLPVITFPGNLGSKSTLLEVFKLMESC